MSTSSLFNELDPPPGGTERFARRLDEIAAERPPRRTRILAMAAAAAVVAVVTTVVLQQRRAGDAAETAAAGSPPSVEVYGAPEFDRLLGRASQPAELTVVVNAETAAVTELQTANQKIRIYQIN